MEILVSRGELLGMITMPIIMPDYEFEWRFSPL